MGIRIALKQFEYFLCYTEDQIIQCCTLGRIKQYNNNDILYSQDKGRQSSVYFLLSGSCTIIQILKMTYTNVHNKKQYHLNTPEKLDSPSRILLEQLHCEAEKKRRLSSLCKEKYQIKSLHCKLSSGIAANGKILKDELNPCLQKTITDTQLETKFVYVGTFSSGSVFGLGEEMIDRMVVAQNIVLCLELPRYLLLQKTQNLGNIWQRLKMYLNSSIPSRQQLFDDFNRTIKWNKYKDNVVEEILNLNPTYNTTRITDIPVLCRVLRLDARL